MDGLSPVVTRPAVRWYGGKFRIAPWIIAHLPPHRIYVEPFGGGGSVLLRKPRAYAEVYNDLDDWIVNLFRVLRAREKSARLIELLHLTPFSRVEFEETDTATSDDVENARRLVVRAFMGFGANAYAASPASRGGFRGVVRGNGKSWNGLQVGFRSTGFRANSTRSGTTPAHDWTSYPHAVAAIVERLQGVVIEHRDAFEVMAQHDHPDALFYVDPPYLPEVRAPSNKYDLKHRMYRHELTREDHVRLLDFLRGLDGMVVLSGYPAPLYDDTLKDWRRVTRRAYADGARERTEVLYINRAAVTSTSGGALFAGVA